MAFIKILKIDTDGVPVEHSTSDELSFGSFTVSTSGQVLSVSGLDMKNTPIVGIASLNFFAPSTNTINQTAGALIIDNIMAKDRDNIMGVSGTVKFPVVTDTPAQLAAFRLPVIAGQPSATPNTGGAGYEVYDSTSNKVWLWTGSAWQDGAAAQELDNLYTADASVTGGYPVYISSNNGVTAAKADAQATAKVVGLATANASASANVFVRSGGLLNAFSGLVAGTRYYLSGAAAGALVTAAPTASGNTIIQVGYAKNATTLQIQIAELGRRS